MDPDDLTDRLTLPDRCLTHARFPMCQPKTPGFLPGSDRYLTD
jgi:hypothetical protein